VEQGLSVRGQDVAAPSLSAGACARPGVAAAQTAATTAALAALPVAAQAQSSDPTAGEICCSALCCLFCCCPLFAFASEVAEGILQFICDILCCFSSYR
jgi:hypothetical protein